MRGATPVFFALDHVRRPLSDEVVAIGPLACLDWNACLVADEGITLDFLAPDSLDWVGSLLSDEVGSCQWSESVEAGSMAAAFFFAMRAALASATHFFFARSPMVDKKDKQGELNYLGSSRTKLVLVHKPFRFEVEHCLFFVNVFTWVSCYIHLKPEYPIKFLPNRVFETCIMILILDYPLKHVFFNKIAC